MCVAPFQPLSASILNRCLASIRDGLRERLGGCRWREAALPCHPEGRASRGA